MRRVQGAEGAIIQALASASGPEGIMAVSKHKGSMWRSRDARKPTKIFKLQYIVIEILICNLSIPE